MEPKHFEALYPNNSRFLEIQTILQYIKEGKSCQLVALPAVGRSNTLGLLSYNRDVRIKHLGTTQEKFHFVMINFSEVRKRPLVDVTKFLFLNLVESFRERGLLVEYKKAHALFKDALGLNDELVLFQGLKRIIDLLALEKELTIVFLFDRFEEYVPLLTPEFFTNLRVLRNRAKFHFSVVFSQHRPLEDMLEPQLYADFYEFFEGNSIYLPLMDKPGLVFRIEHLEKLSGKSIPQPLKDHIITLTAGHGKLTRIALEILLAQSTYPDEKTLQEFLLNQKPIQQALHEIWHALTPSEQQTLTQNSTQTNPYLEHVGLIQGSTITLPLLAAYLANEAYEQAHMKEKEVFTYDADTNEIKKGDYTLSDQLTSSEFRLLRFLLENQEKIVERDEIINTVWKDTTSTLGVTDQALDQLIFRLRKKIETDPNNPIHLQTVKGRGFKFVA